MAVDYEVLDYTIKSLVEMLMKKYSSSYDSSLEFVLNSRLYANLLNKPDLLEEGDIYLFSLLDKEYTDLNT